MVEADADRRRRENRRLNVYYGLIALGMVLFWIVGSAIEARSYNRLTGSDVSTWDAMFLNLVVGHDAPRRGR